MNNVKVKFDNEKIGMGYKQHFITKESLIEKNGNFWFKCVNDNTCDDWIDSINEYNHKMYIENFDNIPIGLEKKISLHWFSYFFNWNKMDTYKVDNFHGNWLDVPFPYKSGIKLFSDVIKSLFNSASLSAN